MTPREEIIKKILGKANEHYPDSEIYLYGSQARGDYHKYSDWDLLILLNLKKVPFELETKIMDDFYDIELEMGEVISPLIYAKSEWKERRAATPFYEHIKREGVVS